MTEAQARARISALFPGAVAALKPHRCGWRALDVLTADGRRVDWEWQP